MVCVVLCPFSEPTADLNTLTNLRIGLRILLKTGFQALLSGTGPQDEVYLLLTVGWEEGGWLGQCLQQNGGRCETTLHEGQSRFA